MKTLQKQMFEIIKNALLGEKRIFDDQVDWNEIMRVARSAHIVPMVYYGIHPEQPMDEELRKLFRQITYQSMVVDRSQSGALHKLERLFRENDLDYMLLKGASIKALYPYTEIRSMGDLDVLIRLEQYETIRQVLLANGFVEGAETDHELIWYKKPYTQFELHKHLIPSYNDDYYGYFGDGWSLAEADGLHGKYAMSCENELIYIFTHFAKHYRDGGIGIRHLVDLWVYRRAYPQMDFALVENEMEKLGLRAFYQNVLKTLEVCFEGAEATEVTDFILDWIFGSRVYGNEKKSDASNALRASKRNKSVAVAGIKSLWRQIFLPYSVMKIKYRVLERVPVLLPVMWLVRWVEAIFFKRDHISRQSERLKAINRKTVQKYQDDLNFVGLDFNF